mgnify:CR=1 FL=1
MLSYISKTRMYYEIFKDIFLIVFILPSIILANGHKLEEQNLKVVESFWANILSNPDVAMELIHEDFEFEFMGICEICKKYNKETYESTWLNEVIPAVLPNGITLNITNRIAGGDMVVFTIEGEAVWYKLGEYNNKLRNGNEVER